MEIKNIQPTLVKVVRAPDGTIHESEAAAREYLARPLVITALAAIQGSSKEMAEFLLENRTQIVEIFDTGTIRRVTKSERRRLADDVERIKADAAEYAAKQGKHPYPFIAEYADSILATFRHPTVTRLKPEERDLAIHNSLMAMFDNDESVEWVIANKAAILEAFNAGKPKRQVPEKAAAGLAAWRARKAAEAAAKASGEIPEPADPEEEEDGSEFEPEEDGDFVEEPDLDDDSDNGSVEEPAVSEVVPKRKGKKS